MVKNMRSDMAQNISQEELSCILRLLNGVMEWKK